MTAGTRITIETERILLLVRKQLVRGGCEKCGSEVGVEGAIEAERLLRSIPGQLHEKSESRLHLQRAKDGLIVCARSLLLFVKAVSRDRL